MDTTFHLLIASGLALNLCACSLDDSVHVTYLAGGAAGSSVTAGTSSSTTGSSTGAAGASSSAATSGTTTTGAATSTTAGPTTTTGDMTTGPTTTGDMTTGAGGAGGAGGGGTGGGTGGPTGVTLTDPMNSDVTPGTGGSEYTDNCADGQVLVSFTGTWGGMYMGLESLQGACATLGVSSSAPYQVTLTAGGSVLGPHGQESPTTIDGVCPDGQAVTGFEGRSGDWVDQLTFYCSPLTITDNAGTFTLDVGTASPITTAVGPDTGTPFSTISCPTGKIAVGIFGRSGAAIDAVGIVCATPTLTTMRR
jgi:hypothetical protein